MANPTCTTASLITSCFKCPLQEKQRMAFKVWFMVNELAAIGGTDYTAALGTTLLDDANDLISAMTRDDREVAELSIAFNNAVEAGATLSTDVNTLIEDVRLLVDASDDQLQQMYLLLLCKLGVHKDYPQ